MQLTDWLDDLSVRFIVNLPREELESVERICFQVEEAQWFYEDFVRPLDPNLPSLSLRQFSMKIFQHCPLFSSYDAELHSQAFSEFLAYKTRVPVRGAILLNETLDQVILVKGWKKGANWSFPRGKINKDEKDIDCAIREVYEETGYDVRAAGLIGQEEGAKYIEITMREQHMKLFVFAGVSMSTHFEPRTRKEISKIQWYKLSDLPTSKKSKHLQHGANDVANSNKFYMVAPFLGPLKKIISVLKKETLMYGSANQPTLANTDINTPQERPHSGRGSVKVADNDMGRLMTQLRQSQQASRESNYPEVSNQPHNARLDATRHAANEFHTTSQTLQNDTAARENKASAMLSILRGEGRDSNKPIQPQPLLPRTPFERIFGQPPGPFALSTGQEHSQRAYQDFERHPISKLPIPSSSYAQLQPIFPQSVSQPPTQTNQTSQPHRVPSRGINFNALGSRSPDVFPAPYQQIEELENSQSHPTSRGHESAVPPASRLPPPKLNPHSSTLLDLFKASQDVAATVPTISTGQPPRQELSVSSPAGKSRFENSPPASQPFAPALSSTPALANHTSNASRDNSTKRSSHQENLLSLFRQPKPSPSLVPPDVPVELSAQGSPTHSRVSSRSIKPNKFVRSSQNGQVSDRKRVETLLDSKTSATVTGPLNVPQFDKILRRPNTEQPLETSELLPDRTVQKGPPKPLKILSRPPTTNVDRRDEVTEFPRPKSNAMFTGNTQSRSNLRNPAFQPQILKRTNPLNSTDHTSMAVQSPSENRSNERVSRQTKDQKAALLSLFGKQADPSKSPLPARTGSMVSPLSEKPPAGSELPSPMGFGRPRLGSLQDSSLGLEPSSISVATAGDKKFLLGFLDGVVNKGS